MTIKVSRPQLAWAVDATLPHIGKDRQMELRFSEVTQQLYVHGTDGYTAGLAIVPATDWSRAGWIESCSLALSEAKDLLRQVRCSRKSEEAETVVLQLVPDKEELHVRAGTEALIYDTTPPGQPMDIDTTLRLIAYLRSKPLDNHHQVYEATLFSRFAKAARPGERLRLQPYGVQHRDNQCDYGIALIGVGDHFIGAISGVAYDWQAAVPTIGAVVEHLPKTYRKAG